MDDIAKNLGISKKTLYVHFDNKSNLIRCIVKDFILKDEKEMNQIVERSENAVTGFVNIANHILRLFRRMTPTLIHDLQKYFPEIWTIIVEKHYAFIHNIVKQNIIKGQQSGHYMDDVDPEIITKLYVQMSLVLVDGEIFPIEEYNRMTLITQFMRYHLRGIMTEKGREIAKSIAWEE